MDAVKFLVECHNYCEDCRAKTGDKWTTEKCFMCELNYHINVFKQEGAERMVRIIERLIEEKKKTRQSEFLKMFPGAAMAGDILGICPLCIDKTLIKNCTHCSKDTLIPVYTCAQCRKEYWLAPVEETNNKETN